MKQKNVAASIAMTFIKLTIYILIVILLINLGKGAYSFGYAVLTDEAMDREPGADVTVTIRSDTSVYNIGKLLQRKGLISDAKVFFVQEFISEYHGDIVAGTYILNTSYTTEEILGVLAQATLAETDENGEIISETE